MTKRKEQKKSNKNHRKKEGKIVRIIELGNVLEKDGETKEKICVDFTVKTEMKITKMIKLNFKHRNCH